MYKNGSSWVFSPSDLTLFWQSRFASWMERFTKEHPEADITPDPDDALAQALQKRGYQHEEHEIAQLSTTGKNVVRIDPNDREQALSATQQAMHGGVDVIFQARLESLPFAGFADFLVKVPGNSKLGNYHYEVWDTKLSGKLQGYFAIQLCAYAEMLEAIQGRKPEFIAVVLGNGEQNRLPIRDYYAYYQAIKAEFLRFQQAWSEDHMPNPERARSLGRWQTYAEQMLRKRDSLSQIAGISKNQIKNLETAGITTMAALASSQANKVAKVSARVFQKLRQQCQLQIASRDKNIPVFEVVDHAELPPDHGLKHLPPASDQDVYFDIEGFPLIQGGLEYLWGASYKEGGKVKFKDFWAHDSEQEQQAFEGFIDWVYGRWQQDPGMHVYHYASYEITAIQKLMGRYGSREHEVDELLRGGVFIDLYKIVRQALRIGQDSYSIKSVEHLYRGKRTGDVSDAATSVVFYEAWLDAKDGTDWQTSAILKDIRDYNIDDCESTLELTEWLRQLQHEHAIAPTLPPDKEVNEAREEERQEIAQLKARLKECGDSAPEALLLSQLLEFHRREDKPKWWRYFDRLSQDEDELYRDLECLVGLRLSNTPPRKSGRSTLYAYDFDANQDCKLKNDQAGVIHHDPATNANLMEIDYDQGRTWFSFGKNETPPKAFTFVPKDRIGSGTLANAIRRFVQRWLDDALPSQAVPDFLRRRPPRIEGRNGGTLLTKDTDLHEQIALVSNLDGSCLCIQGPPGAGKTYTASHMIAHLVANGKRVGVTSNSHKAINHLLAKSFERIENQEHAIRAVKINSSKDDPLYYDTGIEHCSSAKKLTLDDTTLLVGGTAWTFCDESMEQQFDYLFIDESGQVSIANLLAMALSSRNIVFLGDQMQLAQPIQGSHPGDSGKSILDYLLEDHATIPPDLGIFLPHTYRLHPEICRFISEMVYDNRLESASDAEKRVFADLGALGLPQAGIAYVPIDHEGNSQASEEEVAAIVRLTKDLLGRVIGQDDGSQRPLNWDDILYVAPYNFQVRKLKEALGEKARVGSVDKFQGQEASMVIMSMCASNAENGRGIDFLFSKNRLNVALSRAQTLAIVVGHPDLPITFARSIEQMSQINLYARLIESATCIDLEFDGIRSTRKQA